MRAWKGLMAAMVVATAVSACASTGSNSGMSYDRISATELEEMKGQVGNLHDLISRVRPRWLQVRGQQSFSGEQQVVVYQDNSLLGGVDVLEGLGLDLPLYLTYMDGPQAMARLSGLGSRRIEGAIIIHTR